MYTHEGVWYGIVWYGCLGCMVYHGSLCFAARPRVCVHVHTHPPTQALRRVQGHWARHEDYARACSRFKSIRQDLRVQHVETPFTVKVRAHAVGPAS